MHDVQLDHERHQARFGSFAVTLRTREFSLLAFLMGSPNTWLAERRIMEEAFGLRAPHSGLLRVHVSSLRKALGPLASCIQSQRGAGYRFVPL
jgi:DNA-binding response OmpR family regulator